MNTPQPYRTLNTAMAAKAAQVPTPKPAAVKTPGGMQVSATASGGSKAAAMPKQAPVLRTASIDRMAMDLLKNFIASRR